VVDLLPVVVAMVPVVDVVAQQEVLLVLRTEAIAPHVLSSPNRRLLSLQMQL